VQNTGATAVARGGDAGAFFTGALAVVAATPCTAPFMAGAIGAALTQSAGATLLIFAALGTGFALPLTLMHFLPGLQHILPKPGAWMERVRNVLAFPMFAAAAWLAWVLTQQAGANGGLALMLLVAALGFALMVARWGRAWLIAGLVVFAIVAAFEWRPLTSSAAPAALRADAWSAARVAQLRAEGRAVFVNFTAAWCITCQANELSVLSRPEVADAFARNGVVYLKADWTNQDPAIAAELAAHGRAGGPLYLYYPRGDAPPIVLPQILSEAAINEAIAGVGAPAATRRGIAD
jgi:thiol:disulfide interchange protein DsbD